MNFYNFKTKTKNVNRLRFMYYQDSKSTRSNADLIWLTVFTYIFSCNFLDGLNLNKKKVARIVISGELDAWRSNQPA
jgi:hypothetical protein